MGRTEIVFAFCNSVEVIMKSMLLGFQVPAYGSFVGDGWITFCSPKNDSMTKVYGTNQHVIVSKSWIRSMSCNRALVIGLLNYLTPCI